MTRYAKKTDRNHSEIRDGLRKCGYLVLDTSGIGEGVLDLCVLISAKEQRSLWLEIKDPKKPPSARKLTDAEKIWFEYNGSISRVVETLDEALAVISEYKKECK